MALSSLAAGLLGLSCCFSPAYPAAPVPAPALVPVPASTLQLSLHDTAGGRIGSVLLTCDPAGGTHPAAANACSVLDAAGGDFTKIKPRHQMCTLIYAPVDVTAAGSWRGKPVLYRTTYPNHCAANRDSENVFAF